MAPQVTAMKHLPTQMILFSIFHLFNIRKDPTNFQVAFNAPHGPHYGYEFLKSPSKYYGIQN